MSKLRNMAFQGPQRCTSVCHAGALFDGDLLHREAERQPASLPFQPGYRASQGGRIYQAILWKAAAMFLLFSFIDLVRQKRKFTKDLKMTNKRSSRRPRTPTATSTSRARSAACSAISRAAA
jgi:hypothetical protein